MMRMFNRSYFMIEGANARIQPVLTNDVALAVVNAIKMDETIGQTYDLGGPHVYTYQEMLEMYFNTCHIKPYVLPVKMEEAYRLMNFKWYGPSF